MKKGWRWLIVLLVVGLVGVWIFRRESAPTITPGSVLVINLQGNYTEAAANPLMTRLLGRRQKTLLGLLSELAKVESDDRIHSVIFRIRGLKVGWGRAEEIRNAIHRLSEHGRRTMAYLEEEGFGSLDYYVATGAQRIVTAPSSRSPFIGLAAEYFFLGGFFQKLGVQIEYERVGRYKTAVDQLAMDKMTDANREMSNALLDSIEGRFVSGVAKARGLSPDQVLKDIDQAPDTPQQKLDLKLIDQVAYFDDARKTFDDGPVVKESEYAQVEPSSLGFHPQATFALVTGAGPVVLGEGSVTARGEHVMASDTMAQALEDASKDPNIAAIVLRIDSPGGSALASDLIWRAVEKARDRGKPVIASFSDVAASGGYYAACGADRILSDPETYTGSIGVFALRPVLGGLFQKLGIGVATLQRGARADLLLSSKPLSPGAREVLQQDVQSTYDLFVKRVAAGRKMDAKAVDAIGRGRVWTGEQALKVGLVDELGGLRDAVQAAKKIVGLQPTADVALVQYPKPKSLAEQIAQMLQGVSGVEIPEPLQGFLPGPLRDWIVLLRREAPGAMLAVPPGLVEIH